MATDYVVHSAQGSYDYAHVQEFDSKIFHRLLEGSGDWRIHHFAMAGQDMAIATVEIHTYLVFRGDDGRRHVMQMHATRKDWWSKRLQNWKLTRSDEITSDGTLDGRRL